jgi:limonene-1,2-epoxide hydrolase
VPSCSIGFCVARTKNGLVEVVALAADGDLVLLHRLEQGGLGLGRRAVDLVGEDDVREDRARGGT